MASSAPDTMHGGSLVIAQIDAAAVLSNNCSATWTRPLIDTTHLGQSYTTDPATAGRSRTPSGYYTITAEANCQYNCLAGGNVPAVAHGSTITVGGITGIRVNAGDMTLTRAVIETTSLDLAANKGRTFVGSDVYEITANLEVQFDADEVTHAEFVDTAVKAVSIGLPGSTWAFNAFIESYVPTGSRDDQLITATLALSGSGIVTPTSSIMTVAEFMGAPATTTITWPGTTAWAFSSIITSYGISFTRDDEIMLTAIALQGTGDLTITPSA